MKFRMKSAVAGAVALATAGALALVGAAPASAVSTSPFDPAGNGATKGTISFYDAAGNKITHGPLATPPAYAVADTFTGRPGDTLATLYNYTPDKAAAVGAWTGFGLSSPATIPATGLPGSLAGTPNAVASGIALWYDAAGGVPSALPNVNTDPAWQGLYQVRLYTSGPGQAIDSTVYASATIAVDVTPGEWTLVYPAPVPNSTITTPAASVPSPADHGTSITLSSTVAPAGSAGTVQFFDGGVALAGAVTYVAATGVATSAAFVPADGAHTFTAVFTPANPAVISGSTSGALNYTVNPAGSITSVGLTVAPTTGPAYTSAQLDATVNTTPAASPAGTMVFKDGGATIGTDSTAPYGLTVSAGFSAGVHSFTATFTPTNTTVWGGAVTSAAVPATYDTPSCTTCTDPQTVDVVVPAGTLTITTPYTPTNPFHLGTMALSAAGDRFTAAAQFPNTGDLLTITDTRAGDLPWQASVTASDFTGPGTASISSGNLSFLSVTPAYISGNALNATTKPVVTSNVTSATTTGYAPGTGTGDGLNGGPHQFANATPHGAGSVNINGALQLIAPTSTVAGTYTSTVTFTVA